MLTRYRGLDCQCHGGPPIGSPYTYQWFSFRYCAVCLNSIGRTTTGNEATPGRYARAWRILVHGK